MKNIWSVIFNRAVIDRKTNSLSLFDGLEEITVNFSRPEDLSLPKKNIPINFTVVGLWSDADTTKRREFQYFLEIIDPHGKKIGEFSNVPVFEIGQKRLRTIVQMNGMLITSEGEYTVVIKYKTGGDKFITASKIPLEVKFILNTPVADIKKGNKAV